MKIIENANISTKLLVLVPSAAVLLVAVVATIMLGRVNAGIDRIDLDRVVPLQDLKSISWNETLRRSARFSM